jgi:hypothetical protein
LDLANMIPAPAGIASSSTGYGGQPGQGFSRPNSYGGPSNSWSTASPAMPGFAGNPASNTVPNFGYAPSFSQAPLPVPERATAGLLPGISTPSTPISNMPEPF